MTKAVIQVQQLSKCYRLGVIGSGRLYEDVNRWLARLRKRPDPYLRLGLEAEAQNSGQEFWALRDVSFDVREGEVLGIIGRNGAGKSTLLKILARITAPTAGHAVIRGRVSSLLEVGTGFHPELTGRENIYLNGAILGMRRAEINAKFEAIVEFAEMAKFIDTPVKRYSSGMTVRLAFAVAAHLEPEILIVDEVLAVGDAAFQKKCIGKMEDVSHSGRTVLFVSHNMGVINALCPRCVVLDKGSVAAIGDTHEIVPQYLAAGSAAAHYWRTRPTTSLPCLESAQLIEAATGTENADAVLLQINLKTGIAALVGVDVRLYDGLGNPVGFASLGSLDTQDLLRLTPGSTTINLALHTASLAEGKYKLGLDISNPGVEYYDRVDDCLVLELTRAPRRASERVLQQSWGYGSVCLPLHKLGIQ